MDLDEIDMAMLRALEMNGRASVPEIATKIGVSRATAYTRFERLKQAGVIEATVRVRPEYLGLDLTVVVLLAGGQSSLDEISRLITDIPEVQYAAILTGGFDFMVVIRARDAEHVRELTLNRLRGLPGIRNSQSMLILDEVVNRPNAWP